MRPEARSGSTGALRAWLAGVGPVRLRAAGRPPYPQAVALLGMLPALAAASCDWSRPGAAPYRGPLQQTIPAAVHAYTDIPEPARLDLIARIRAGLHDGLIEIGRERITAASGTAGRLRDMHWRDGLCRGEVSRLGWAAGHVERALVYCAGVQCIAVPVVCGNVARVDYAPAERQAPVVAEPGTAPHRVPEPGTLALAAVALALLLACKVVSPRVCIQARGSPPACVRVRRGLLPSARCAR